MLLGYSKVASDVLLLFDAVVVVLTDDRNGS